MVGSETPYLLVILISFPLMYLPSQDPAARAVSVHPPHLLDSQGRQTGVPAALIPFCAYSSQMAITGEYIDGLDFPVCNKFQPKVLDGQLCYSLSVSSIIPPQEKKTQPGKKNGIFFAIDIEEDSSSVSNNEFREKGILNTKDLIDNNKVSVNLDTLSRYSDTRPGMYIITSLKKMTGTESFLAMADNIKGCQIEPEEECKIRRYTEEVRKQCGCVPWAQGSIIPEKVI
jgi:hypothetical protein